MQQKSKHLGRWKQRWIVLFGDGCVAFWKRKPQVSSEKLTEFRGQIWWDRDQRVRGRSFAGRFAGTRLTGEVDGGGQAARLTGEDRRSASGERRG